MNKRIARRFIEEVSGGSLAEFAMVVPIFLGLVFAVIHLSFITWGMTAMHWAAETAARCAAINVPLGASGATCTDNNTTQAYALSEYKGPNMSVSFTADIASTTNNCTGKKVTGTGTYQLNAVVTSIPLTLKSQACYH